MTELSLAQRLLVRIGQISRRSDVIVREQSSSRGGGNRLGKWKDKLPADMFAFYQAINGLKFHYSFASAPDGWHGLEFVALEEDGRKTIDTFRNIYRIPRQAAKRYPEYFFHPGEVSADTPVLFFFGDDSAWGILMTGEGESASFHHWDNDGFVRRLSGSFTELVERLMARGFAHTWAYSDSHPDTDDVVSRLAADVPPRKTFELTVESLAIRSEEDLRRGRIAAFSPAVHDKILRALGMTKQAKGASPQHKIDLIQGACASLDAITDKVAASVMKATGRLRGNRDDFAEFFRCGAGPVAVVKLRLEYIQGPIPLQPYDTTLLRVLHDIEGFHVTDDLPWPREVLAFTHPPRHRLEWSPFLWCAWDYELKGEGNKVATFEIGLDAPRARGMEAGKTYASSALPSVEARIG